MGVTTELRGHTLLVTMDQPEVRNAIDQDTWDSLGDASHRAYTDAEVRPQEVSLVNQVVASERPLPVALALADRIGRNASRPAPVTTAMRRQRRCLRAPLRDAGGGRLRRAPARRDTPPPGRPGGERVGISPQAAGTTPPHLVVELDRKLIMAGAIACQDFEDMHHNSGAAQVRGTGDVFMSIDTARSDKYLPCRSPIARRCRTAPSC